MHAFYHKLSKTLNSSSLEANGQVHIIRTFIGCIRVRDMGKEGLSFWQEELNSQVVRKTNHLHTKHKCYHYLND